MFGGGERGPALRSNPVGLVLLILLVSCAGDRRAGLGDGEGEHESQHTSGLGGGDVGDSHEQQSAEEMELFMQKLFNKYGEDGLMTFEGFEHLLQSLGIGKVTILDHDIHDHHTNGSFVDFHGNHNHTAPSMAPEDSLFHDNHSNHLQGQHGSEHDLGAGHHDKEDIPMSNRSNSQQAHSRGDLSPGDHDHFHKHPHNSNHTHKLAHHRSHRRHNMTSAVTSQRRHRGRHRHQNKNRKKVKKNKNDVVPSPVATLTTGVPLSDDHLGALRYKREMGRVEREVSKEEEGEEGHHHDDDSHEDDHGSHDLLSGTEQVRALN